MPFRKIKSGILEVENFYTNSNVYDFLGNSEYIISENQFTLHRGVVERNFIHNEFVIQLKENFNPVLPKDAVLFYVSNGEKYGILEKYNKSEQEDFCYWKIIYYDGFLQTYKSKDGYSWKNIGGLKTDNITLQGFELLGNTPFTFSDYKVFKNPYLTIYNYPNNYKAKIFDETENLIKENCFLDNKCKLFLDYCFIGTIKIFDESDNLIFQSEKIQLNYGDEYALTPYDIEVSYQNEILDYTSTLIEKMEDKITVKNISSEIYNNLKLSISKDSSNDDKVLISLDNIDFDESLTIDTLEPNQPKDIYIKIIRTSKYNNDRYRNFNLDFS